MKGINNTFNPKPKSHTISAYAVAIINIIDVIFNAIELPFACTSASATATLAFLSNTNLARSPRNLESLSASFVHSAPPT